MQAPNKIVWQSSQSLLAYYATQTLYPHAEQCFLRVMAGLSTIVCSVLGLSWQIPCCLPCRATGHSFKYAEYDPYGKQSNFSKPYMYQLFNLTSDPFELENLYNASKHADLALLRTLKATLDAYAGCRGAGCP